MNANPGRMTEARSLRPSLRGILCSRRIFYPLMPAASRTASLVLRPDRTGFEMLRSLPFLLRLRTVLDAFNGTLSFHQEGTSCARVPEVHYVTKPAALGFSLNYVFTEFTSLRHRSSRTPQRTNHDQHNSVTTSITLGLQRSSRTSTPVPNLEHSLSTPGDQAVPSESLWGASPSTRTRSDVRNASPQLSSRSPYYVACCCRSG